VDGTAELGGIEIPVSKSGPVSSKVRVIGGGLAGCEAALQLARRGRCVDLWEQKPQLRSPAHTSDALAELVCSNSLRSDQLTSAVGLLKEELRRVGSALLRCAQHCRVPAGGALAVDRAQFSAEVERLLGEAPEVTLECHAVAALPDDGLPTILATGPLTEGALAEDLARVTGVDSLHFYDAIAPIVESESIDRGRVFAASRYGRGDAQDYLNVPLDRACYERFVEDLLAAPKQTPHGFEDSACFDGCLPIEVMAGRGLEVLAHGPMKPVGLVDPSSGERPHAVVQLRKEDRADTARNLVGFQTRLTRQSQRDVLRKLPGLEGARFLRYGSIHRNSFVEAPRVLSDSLELQARPGIWLAGQLAGSEGYVEAIAVGFLAATSLCACTDRGSFVPPPRTTALGGLYAHLRGAAPGSYGPSNITWAMVEPYPGGRRKQERRRAEDMIV